MSLRLPLPFRKLDVDGSGTIDANELRWALFFPLFFFPCLFMWMDQALSMRTSSGGLFFIFSLFFSYLFHLCVDQALSMRTRLY